MHIICISSLEQVFWLASCVISNNKSLINHNQVMLCLYVWAFHFYKHNTVYRENLEGLSLNGMNWLGFRGSEVLGIYHILWCKGHKWIIPTTTPKVLLLSHKSELWYVKSWWPVTFTIHFKHLLDFRNLFIKWNVHIKIQVMLHFVKHDKNMPQLNFYFIDHFSIRGLARL